MKVCVGATLQKGCGPAWLHAPHRMSRSQLLLHPFGSKDHHAQAVLSVASYGTEGSHCLRMPSALTVSRAWNVLVMLRQAAPLTCDSILAEHHLLDVLPQHRLCHCLHHWTCPRTK